MAQTNPSYCSQSGSFMCYATGTITEQQFFHLTGPSGNSGSRSGGPPAAMFIQNNGTVSVNQTFITFPAAGFFAQTDGGQGYEEGNGGAGGVATMFNFGSLGANFNTNTGGMAAVMGVQSRGGAGDPDNKNNNSDGGKGGDGGTVQGTNQPGGLITASGYSIQGISGLVAASQGGRGGAQNGSIFGNQRGGTGGAGGTVSVTNNGVIALGSSANRLTGSLAGAGIAAQSFGGQGGDNNGSAGAGGNVSLFHATVGSAPPASVSAWWQPSTGTGFYGLSATSRGGIGNDSSDDSDDGGAGGNGGTVSVTASGAVLLDILGMPSGSSGAAINAISSGAKGGTGPSKSSHGGDGGTAGATSVTLEATAIIQTSGDSLFGILAQSVGGEGGDGSDGAALAGKGGGGGYGGNAGTVSVSMASGSSITTTGNYASGVAAHSVGGGGGTGGEFVAVLGGSAGNGGNGGNGADVTLSINGTVSTSGAHAYGLLAQSIAGSGGAGGADTSWRVALGGDGAGGGTPGSATIRSTGTVTTSGYASHGVIAQSIGGGGGAAGSSTGELSVGGDAAGETPAAGGSVAIDNRGKISTAGGAAFGMLAQSIGGGGGSGADAKGIIGVGGSGSAGGNGGSVYITGIGQLSTAGAYGLGVVAQSVGGGGGNGGDVHTLSAITSLGIGGSAAGGGSGGAVCIDNIGDNRCTAPGASVPATSPTQISTRGDHASAMLAQSVGGGGGTGGSVKSYSLASFVALEIGGAGGAGGNGGTISVRQNAPSIITGGARAIGILGQSIGGGGGSGGASSYFDATIGFNAALILGGSGGSGGYGNTVGMHIQNGQVMTGYAYDGSAPDSTASTDSYGIVAQSIGGGGGNGGSVSAKDILVAVPTGTGVSVAVNIQSAIGGNGGTGGAGGIIDLDLSQGTSVTTVGDGSHGVIAQSVGAGGGNGGDSSALQVTLGDGDTAALTAGVSVGGGAGNMLPGYNFDSQQGGNGNTVTVSLGDTGQSNSTVTSSSNLQAGASSIRTYGHQANAVVAQSIGGGGGNGGIGNSNAKSAGTVGAEISLGVGGVGGKGGSGSAVTVTQQAGFLIETLGSGSRALLAQSIGGGGGNSQGGTVYVGGTADSVNVGVTVGVGMTGGAGGVGGNTILNSNGVITTYGADADGAVAQSIGGGGGIGGSVGADATSRRSLADLGARSESEETPSDETTSYALQVQVGGHGGSGNHGGLVQLNHSGQITTSGDYADGLVAQSIGGGGGAGGTSTASGSKGNATIGVAVGGHGGSGGDGGAIGLFFDDNHQNSVATSGYAAHGVLLQTIGGGGGVGGDGSDSAEGDIAIGAGAGGTGGGAGNGGSISTSAPASWLNLTTNGADAHGILAQSIGGGGGIGAAGNASSARSKDSHSLQLTVGGGGGASGNGGTINISTGLGLKTYGDRAFGFVAQSIGGGGGLGGAGDSSNFNFIKLGGHTGAAGSGGAVTLDITEKTTITTAGRGSHAIIAQSIGGGGGIAGDLSAGPFNTSASGTNSDGGGGGNGGSVSVSVNGSVTTTGASAFGIIAQSIGGGGGLASASQGGAVYAGFTGSGSATGSGGNVVVNQLGTITAAGTDSVGIFAQSQGPSGNGTVTVNASGTVTGGTGSQGTAIWISEGHDNTVSVTSEAKVSGPGAAAIRYTGTASAAAGARLAIANAGEIAGNVLLHNSDGDRAGIVRNTGTLRDASLYAADVANAGRLIAGSAGGLGRTQITGDFSQSARGALSVGVDFNSLRAGGLDVLGNGSLAGALEIRPVSLRPDRSVSVMSINGQHDGGLTVGNSPVFSYGLDRSGNDYHLRVTNAQFAAPEMALKTSQTAVAGHLQQIWNMGGTDDFGRVFGSLETAAQSGAAAYASQLSDLSPGVSLAPAAQMQAGLTRFGASLMSCPVFSTTGSGLRESDCVWGQISGRRSDHRGSQGIATFNHESVIAQMGMQKEIAPGWFAGLSGGYESARFKGDDHRVTGRSDSGYVGASLKREIGAWTISGAIAGGYGSADMTRRIAFSQFAEVPRASVDVYGAVARLRIAHMFGSESFYLKPYLDLDAIYSRTPSYRERGGGPLALQVESAEQLTFAATPAIEVGGRVTLENGWTLRPYLQGGVAFLSESGWDAKASFVGAPAGLGAFTTQLQSDRIMARVGAGLQLDTKKGLQLRVQYDGEFSERVTSNSATLRLVAPF
jgi:hypothetical protein